MSVLMKWKQKFQETGHFEIKTRAYVAWRGLMSQLCHAQSIFFSNEMCLNQIKTNFRLCEDGFHPVYYYVVLLYGKTC